MMVGGLGFAQVYFWGFGNTMCMCCFVGLLVNGSHQIVGFHELNELLCQNIFFIFNFGCRLAFCYYTLNLYYILSS